MNKLFYPLVGVLAIVLCGNSANASKNKQYNGENDTVIQYSTDNETETKLLKSNKNKKAERHNTESLKKSAKIYSDKWLANKTEDINEDFDEAIYKIGKTSMPQELKDLLIKQAQENKTLALKQASEVNNQLKKQSLAREKFHEQFMNEKMNKKIIKRIDEIIK